MTTVMWTKRTMHGFRVELKDVQTAECCPEHPPHTHMYTYIHTLYIHRPACTARQLELLYYTTYCYSPPTLTSCCTSEGVFCVVIVELFGVPPQ